MKTGLSLILLLAGLLLNGSEAFFAPLESQLQKSWDLSRDPTVISVKDGTLLLRCQVPEGGQRRLGAYFSFKPGLNLNDRILAIDLRPVSGVDHLRITLENRPENRRGSYLVDRKLLSPEHFSTVYLSRDRQRGATAEPKLELGSDRSNLITLVFNIYGRADSSEIALEVRNPRWVDEIPPETAAPPVKAPEPKTDYSQIAPFPADWQPYVPKRAIELADAVIVAAQPKRDHGLGVELQQAFKRNWGKDFPILDEKTALASGKNLILYGRANANNFLIRFAQNGQLYGNFQGYELRTLPDAFDLKRDFFYFGGGNPEQIRAGYRRFFEKFPRAEKIPHFIECDQTLHASTPEGNELERLRAHFAKDDQIPCYYALTNHLVPMAMRYRATGTRENGEMLLQMLRCHSDYYLEHGEQSFFTVYMLFQIYDLIEEFELCTPDDLRAFAEVVRRYSIDNFADPTTRHYRKLVFDAGKQQYLLNSICFRLRSLGTGARHLLDRYDYPPAREWKQCADFMLAGVAEHPFSPEDAIGYQTMTYAIFMNYALSNGLYPVDFFNNPVFRANVDYFKLQYNHQGWNPCYGDSFGLYMVSGTEVLRIAADVLDDEEAEYLLTNRRGRQNPEIFSNAAEAFRSDLPPPGTGTLGLNYQTVNDFKLNYDFPGRTNVRPLLDKAGFRSGWEATADYLGVTGMNRGFHGHFDAGGISQFLDGDRVWLHEGHYVERFPMHHNMLSVSRDGYAPIQYQSPPPDLPDAAAQLLGAPQTADRRASQLSLLLEDYGGADWIRHIGYEPQNGFWVIDTAAARSAGEYAFDLRFRVIGDLEAAGNLLTVRQLPSDRPEQAAEFVIASGDSSTLRWTYRFERGHGDKDGSIAAYPYKTSPNIGTVVRRQQGTMQAGDRKVFVNFLSPRYPRRPDIEVRQLAANAWSAASAGGLRLAVLGKWKSGIFDLDADMFFAGPGGITATGVRRLTVAGQAYQPDADGNLAIARTELPVAYELEAWRRQGETVSPAAPPELAAPIVQPDRTLEFPERIGAVAADRSGFFIGRLDGCLSAHSPDGEERWTVKLPAPVNTLSPVRDRNDRLYLLAGTANDRPTGESKSFVYALSESGEQLWSTEFAARDRRHPVIQTIFPARLSPDYDAVFVGSETWQGYALKLDDGSILWRTTLEHGFHTGIAADMTGDGLDEIIPGGTYLYAPIFKPDGSRPSRPSLSPGCQAVAAADLDGDGFAEALFGREDGYLYVYGWRKGPYQKLEWQENLGGAIFGLGILPGNRIFAVTVAGNAVILPADRKSRSNRYFPAAFTDLTRTANGWAAPARDGYLYLFDPDGELTGKMPYEPDQQAVQRPRAAGSEAGAILFSGRRAYLLTRS